MVGSFYRTVLGYLGFGDSGQKSVRVDKTTKSEESKTSVASPVVSGEKLTDEKMQNLFGVNYSGIMYYNYDTKSWRGDKYLGYCMPYQDVVEKDAVAFKRLLEAEPDFKNFELVAFATMLIKDRYFPGVASKIVRPFFNQKGRAVVGTIVVRDRKDGKILPLPSDWVGVYFPEIGHCNAIWYGPKWMATNGLEMPEFRRRIIRNYTKQR